MRRVKGEVRGAWTTSQESGIESGRPELAELSWVRPSTDAAVATPGIRVKLRLNIEKHSAAMLRKNISFDGLSIMGSGIKGMIEGKASDNLTAVLAHRCRLESFEESGKKHFDAALFVPQDRTSDGANIELSQKRLDQMQEQGVEFWLDHHRDQLSSSLDPGRQPSQEKKQEVTDERD